jgi:murein L,D-transpeptidase YcbB/YkuD
LRRFLQKANLKRYTLIKTTDSLLLPKLVYKRIDHTPEHQKKEILPGLQASAGYTRRKGYSILDAKGGEVNPYAVKWTKYRGTIPFQVVQGSGDANALGVIKFNFSNPYAVYLHDTNQRYLFGKSSRALVMGV